MWHGYCWVIQAGRAIREYLIIITPHRFGGMDCKELAPGNHENVFRKEVFNEANYSKSTYVDLFSFLEGINHILQKID